MFGGLIQPDDAPPFDAPAAQDFYGDFYAGDYYREPDEVYAGRGRGIFDSNQHGRNWVDELNPDSELFTGGPLPKFEFDEFCFEFEGLFEADDSTLALTLHVAPAGEDRVKCAATDIAGDELATAPGADTCCAETTCPFVCTPCPFACACAANLRVGTDMPHAEVLAKRLVDCAVTNVAGDELAALRVRADLLVAKVRKLLATELLAEERQVRLLLPDGQTLAHYSGRTIGELLDACLLADGAEGATLEDLI